MKIRWGLLSTAHINNKLIPAIRNSNYGELVAVASRDEKKARSYARQWKIPQVFGDYEALLASDKIDVVYMGLPNHLHAEWMIKAMRAGKHVLCEKPFVLSVEEMDEVIKVKQETGMKILEGFMYRYHPQTQQVMELVGSGVLGEINVVHGTFQFKLNDATNIRWNPKYGGGALWDVGLYPMSYIQLVMGEPPMEVFGQMRLSESGVDELFLGQMKYSGNRLAQIRCGFSMPYTTSMVIMGTKGRLEIQRPFNEISETNRFLHVDESGKEHWIKFPKFDLYTGEVDDLSLAIMEDREPILTLEETRNHVRTLNTLYQSAKENRFVVMD